jgi:cyclic pyranopterin phosphate synthase
MNPSQLDNDSKFLLFGSESKRKDFMSMRDISSKQTSVRTATARAVVRAKKSTIEMVRENKVPKGDPFPLAKAAAVHAAKNTSQLIPYCHPLLIDFADCAFNVKDDSIEITTEVKATYKTGVEMEALTAAVVAALTVYDMLKMVDTSIEIEQVSLLKKTGGKSDYQKTGK